MKTIRNTKLFEELVSNCEWSTLFTNSKNYPEPKDRRLPTLVGGLDHIEQKSKGFYFYDIGCNGKDNSFIIRRNLT